ncbi:hypothetical protein BY996DRAFT_6487372 [Phakopsora pachyrhizi]|nr:hypothetical protein BY996DRAFT_6487372 [Phakopsora pachyrhizi]
MTVLIYGKLEDPLIKDKKVSLLGGVICGQKISMDRDRCGKLPKAERAGLGRISQGRRLEALCGDGSGSDILQGQRHKALCGIAGPTKARMRFGGIKFVRRIRKPWEGKRPAGGRTGKGREVSVGLVRRRETPHQHRTDIGGISKTVVGRAVLSDFDIGRRRHTEVRSSYHFRVRTKFRNKERTKEIQDLSQSLDMTNDDSREK